MPAIAFILLAGLALAGCSARSGVDALQSVKTSPETTSSIAQVDAAVAAGDAGIEQIIQMTALAEPEHLKAPALQQVAMRVPSAPAARSQPSSDNKIYRQRFSDAKPVNFGKVTPQHHAVHGVDVSRYQREIDWQKLRRQGANFAFIKATEGGDHIDPMFGKNWEAAHRAGIKRGAYHFFYWCRTAAEQAEWFIRNVPKVKGALPPVLDLEYNHQSNCKRRWSTENVREKMQVFMDRLERHYGQRPIIYTAPDFYEDHLKGAFPNHPFWLRSVAAHPSKVYPGRDWVFWQYSGSGLSHGVDGRIDLNVFRGDEKAWWRWVNQASG